MTATVRGPAPLVPGAATPSERVSAAVLLFEKDAGPRQVLAGLLPPAALTLSFDELADADGVRVPAGLPLVFVLGPSQAGPVALAQASGLLAAAPGRAAVLVAQHMDAGLMRTAMRSGFGDAIDMEHAPPLLSAAVAAVAQRAGESLALVQAAPVAKPATAFITTVFSPKGGVGKSVVAVNLAAALASGAGPAVVLDLDVQFGDDALMLRLVPHHTLADAVSAGELLDEELLRSFLAHHDKSGVDVLPATTSPSGADQLPAAAFMRVLSLLAGMYSYVVIDTPPQLNEAVLQAVARSDLTCFVVGMDVPSVKSARLALQAFEVISVPRDRILVTLNRAGSRVFLTTADVEKALGARVGAALPSDICVPQSVNQGSPAVLVYPRSPFSVEMASLAEEVMERASRPARALEAGR